MSELTMKQQIEQNNGVFDENVIESMHGAGDTGNSEPVVSPFKFDFSFLTRETGDGEIESYLNHPLNFKQSKGLAQVLRGISGFAGSSLKYAVLDIVFGFFRLQRETKPIGNTDNKGAIYSNGDNTHSQESWIKND